MTDIGTALTFWVRQAGGCGVVAFAAHRNGTSPRGRDDGMGAWAVEIVAIDGVNGRVPGGDTLMFQAVAVVGTGEQAGAYASPGKYVCHSLGVSAREAAAQS